MSDIAIKVENLGKLYRLGEVGTGTISHDLNRWWAKLRGKEDPFAVVGETNDRTTKGESDYVWAIKDVSFEVKKGEVLGIIGRNGAGKSTLLKLLSKVTQPTEGQIKIAGRIASLLEVGTGFHPEMTGRENIFQNGAILGMTKVEIKSKFDEIVDFSGVERYIDTPVKRYSSGMYVRLAFAVAAHLEPEILIVDEVLAVGDAEFQKKCIGKMKDVSVNDGRTVLFVSHNMGAVQDLCDSGMLMIKGMVETFGKVDYVLDEYIRQGIQTNNKYQSSDISEKTIQILGAEIVNAYGEMANEFASGDVTFLRLYVKNISSENNVRYNISLLDKMDRLISVDSNFVRPNQGYTSYEIAIPSKSLTPNTYKIGLSIDIPAVRTIEILTDNLSFEIVNINSEVGKRADTEYGILLPDFQWKIIDA